jgi:hypothetical protein
MHDERIIFERCGMQMSNVGRFFMPIEKVNICGLFMANYGRQWLCNEHHYLASWNSKYHGTYMLYVANCYFTIALP